MAMPWRFTVGLLLTSPAVRVQNDDRRQQFKTAKPHQDGRKQQGTRVH